MFNVYVHLDVRNVSTGSLDDEEFIEAVWRELPDAGLGGRDDVLTVTLSQFSLSRDRAASRQLERVRTALAKLEFPSAHVRVDETIREGWRDDVAVVAGAVGGQVCRLAARM